MTKTIVDNANIPKLRDTLVVFIKQEQAKAKHIENVNNKHQKSNNSSWIKKYLIQIYSFIIT